MVFCLSRVSTQVKAFTLRRAAEFQTLWVGKEPSGEESPDKIDKNELVVKRSLQKGVQVQESRSSLERKTKQRSSMRLPTRVTSHSYKSRVKMRFHDRPVEFMDRIATTLAFLWTAIWER